PRRRWLFAEDGQRRTRGAAHRRSHSGASHSASDQFRSRCSKTRFGRHPKDIWRKQESSTIRLSSKSISGNTSQYSVSPIGKISRAHRSECRSSGQNILLFVRTRCNFLLKLHTSCEGPI